MQYTDYREDLYIHNENNYEIKSSCLIDGCIHGSEWEAGEAYLCDAVGFGAVAIKRWVFDQLEASGFTWPYFRFEYEDGGLNVGGEDMRFNRACRELGIKMVCLTDLEIPHMVTSLIDSNYWRRYLNAFPSIIGKNEEVIADGSTE